MRGALEDPSKVLIHFCSCSGDKESGKTTLIAKLQGNEDPKKGAGLEYGYINVRDEYREGNFVKVLEFISSGSQPFLEWCFLTFLVTSFLAVKRFDGLPSYN